jgi:hypothetical protein
MHRRLVIAPLFAAVAIGAGLILGPAGASAGPTDPVVNVSDDSVIEHTGAELWFDISRTVTTGTTTAQYGVTPGTASASDYGTPFDNDANPNDSVATFTAGVGTVRVTVPVVNDSLVEGDEDLFLDLGTIVGGLRGDDQGHAVILDDEEAPPPCNVQCEMAKRVVTLIQLLNPGLPAVVQTELAKIVNGQGSALSLSFLMPLLGTLNLQLLLKTTVSRLGKGAAAAKGGTVTATATTAVTQTGQQQVVLTISKRGRKLLRKAKLVKGTLTVGFTDNTGSSATDSVTVKVKKKKKKKK